MNVADGGRWTTALVQPLADVSSLPRGGISKGVNFWCRTVGTYTRGGGGGEGIVTSLVGEQYRR